MKKIREYQEILCLTSKLKHCISPTHLYSLSMSVSPDSNTSKLYMGKFMIDGWFKARHLRMKYPEDDVPIADGHGFMVTDAPYQKHLEGAVQHDQVRNKPIRIFNSTY